MHSFKALSKCLLLLAAVVIATDNLGSGSSTAQQQGERAPAGRRLLFVLDASGSMNQRLADGQTRLDAARSALVDMVAKLTPQTSVALRVYGHRSATAKRDCEDTELLVGFGPASDRLGEIKARVAGLKALGYTPISRSLQLAAEDLEKGAAGERTVILISDGRETCKADPCAVAQALSKAQASLIVHTIGFGVDDAARRQLQCIASVARGSYFDAGTREELSRRLGEVARMPAPAQRPPAPVADPKRPAGPAVGYLTIKGIGEAGVPVFKGGSGDIVGTVGTVGSNRQELPAGIYSVQLTNGLWTGIEIKAGEVTELDPAYLRIENPSNDNIAFIDTETGEELGSTFQNAVPLIALVPGRYHLRTSQPFEWRDVEFKAGQTTPLRPAVLRILDAAAVHRLYTITAAGGATGSATKDADVSLPAGRYVISNPDTGLAPIAVELKEGEVREVTIGR